ncbi:glutaminase [Bartonella heixiaziensis]
MLRPLFKLMAFISFTLMIIALVIDVTHSMSTSHWKTTPLNKMLANFLHTDTCGINQSIHNATIPLLHSICITLICLPIWSILGTLAIIFCMLSYEKQKPLHKIFYKKENTFDTL